MLKNRRNLSSTLDDRPATLTRSRLRSDRFELRVDGIAQSVVSMADPTRLVYPYTRHIARALDAAAPAGASLFTVHLGAGALTMARYVAATRTGSPQLAVEFEPELYASMLEALPLPAGSDVRVIFGDARAVADAPLVAGPAAPASTAAVAADVAEDRGSRADVRTAVPAEWAEAQFTIVDLWDAAVIHRRVASQEFFARVAERSAAAGVVVVNLLDGHPFEYARRQAATLGSVWSHVAVVLDADPFDADGPLGNVLIFASNEPLAIAADPSLLGLPLPHVLSGAQLDSWIGAARIMTDGDSTDSPDPNDPRWG
ncbi:spermidine synthase [Leucobacter komagatae]|uniref:spermidine synthase n=1 Tax=Leucobacter komagatae TaxID=55969 RepID=UPI0012ED1DEE|nr:hypothetical protein [Leucobacter komagatae]